MTEPEGKQKEETQPKEDAKTEQICCDGKRTAAEHRKESPDGKCCTDT